MKVNMPTEHDLEMLVAAPPLALDISGMSALNLLGALQLVLRHSGFSETAPADTARKLAERLEAHIVEVSPGMKELCEAGWNPAAELVR